MKILGIQMVAGLMSPKKVEVENSMVGMLPKKKNPPPFKKEMGTEGWDMHAKMGFCVEDRLVACHMPDGSSYIRYHLAFMHQ